jgi:hypothetical protein
VRVLSSGAKTVSGGLKTKTPPPNLAEAKGSHIFFRPIKVVQGRPSRPLFPEALVVFAHSSRCMSARRKVIDAAKASNSVADRVAAQERLLL